MKNNTMIKVTVKSTQVDYAQIKLIDGDVVAENGVKVIDGHKTIEQAQKIIAKEKIGVMVREVKPLVEKYVIGYEQLKKYGNEM